MSKSVVVVGIGEMGSVFARGFLRLGYTVHPVIRDREMQAVCGSVEEPELVLIAVAEADLHDQLKHVPQQWIDKSIRYRLETHEAAIAKSQKAIVAPDPLPNAVGPARKRQ